MKKIALALTGIIACSFAVAENVEGTDDMLCAVARVQLCYENGECFAVSPAELSIPDFVLVDTKKKTLSTTKASGMNRTTPFSRVERDAGLILLQGVEAMRAFSFVIDEASGHMTAAVARDGFSVTAFGICTPADP